MAAAAALKHQWGGAPGREDAEDDRHDERDHDEHRQDREWRVVHAGTVAPARCQERSVGRLGGAAAAPTCGPTRVPLTIPIYGEQNLAIDDTANGQYSRSQVGDWG